MDSHDYYSLERLLGRVVSFEVKDGKLIEDNLEKITEAVRVGKRAMQAEREKVSVVRAEEMTAMAMPMTVPLQLKTGAKVKLELSRRNNANVIEFAKAHDRAIGVNPAFPMPLPEPGVFREKLSALEQVNAEYEQMRLALQALAERRDRVRAEFDAVFTQRGAYVGMQSGGNAELIQEVALPVKSPPKKLGPLSPPVGLRIDLGLVPGEMWVRWNGVTRARGYLLESCLVEPDGRREWKLVKVGGSKARLKDLEIGIRYAFRVAAVGGAGGRSEWSPAVERVAG